ncbi:RHS repeat-associated core domain-containing protein [Pseudomonas koreensis]|uniref:RHS repeat-associated core domain-containing protein n=1 Tax=Pseudomonas koreensis TaxID=198620 RepID=UPI00320A2499
MKHSVHWRTPALLAHDPRGLPLRNVAYLRSVADADAEGQITRQQYDAAGRLVLQRDPRLMDGVSPPNLHTVYDLSARPVRVDSVDAGWRLILPGLAGEERQRWDARGHHREFRHDALLRLLAVTEDAQVEIERYTYTDHTGDAGHNRRGALSSLWDLSGTLALDSYSLGGQVLRETRTFHDDQSFSSRRVFSPLGAVLEQTDAAGHRQQSHHGLGAELKQIQLLINGLSQWQTVLLDARYNAADQIIEQRAGNGVRSQWTYDPVDGRLHTHSSRKANGTVLQDFEYFHDPVGNIVRIEDHAFQPVYFANQLVEGHRDFNYDSLYRLSRATGHDNAPPSDIPGLPQPSDPNNRLNYTQTYTYDTGGNLTEIKHVRAGANHTRQMSIDPYSNRGVRWHPDDPAPDFDQLFDRHGNQQALQPGQGMQWSTADELQSVVLISRGGTRDDAEHYRYSQGVRVFKRHETFTDSAAHFHQVRYLSGLEIRSKDNGEELHVIRVGNARCLHWARHPPRNIDNNQLRYNLDDHLGSCVMELDQDAQLISHEGYYPFGATAWMTAQSAIDASYKFIRYSGKEMDVSGLYYYGARYYAPWLQRWVSADPAGDVDGLNLYAFVGNEPMGHVDGAGTMKLPRKGDLRAGVARIAAANDAAIERDRVEDAPRRARQALSTQVERHLSILALSLRRGVDAQQQILNHRSTSDFTVSTLRRGGAHLAGQMVAYGAGIAVGIGSQALGAAAPGVGNVVGVAMGFAAKKVVSALWDYATERTGVSASIKFKASRLSKEKIIQKAEYKSLEVLPYIQQKYAKIWPDTQKGRLKGAKEGTGTAISLAAKSINPTFASEISATANTVLGAVEIGHEIAGASADLSAKKIAEGALNLTELIDALNSNMAKITQEFETSGISAMHTFSLLGTTPGDTVESLTQATQAVIGELAYTRTMLLSHSHRFTAV